jgi:EAL domain-containing protein (putative c-di-GMP-specific phosphodiesterase class I)
LDSVRLLGFAFAGADVLFEVDRAGAILFVTGSTSLVADDRAAVGRAGAELFQIEDGRRFKALARNMSPGERIGPTHVALSTGANAVLSMCFLPQNDRISCTLVRPGPLGNLGVQEAVDPKTGLTGQDAFFTAVKQCANGRGAVALVNMPNLSEVCAKLSSKETDGLMAHIGASMKAMGATSAARLSENRFGIVSPDPDLARGIADRIKSAVRQHGIDGLDVEEILLSLKGRGLSREQNILVLRHVVGQFSGGKMNSVPSSDLVDIFDGMVSETISRAEAFCSTISNGAFDLVFEPIVNLKSGALSHFEALTRFAPGQSPAEMICLAEELDLIDTFDLAVAVKLFALLENDPANIARVAMNVSARSIATPSSFAMLSGLLLKKRAMAKRMSIEITESAEITDLAAASKAIQSLRLMGYRVGIDDFGSGAASLTYLHTFAVDFVKIDGALIKRLGASPREDALLKSLAVTCKGLNIETIAEWIDSDEKLRKCREMGFGFGQGRQFGDPLTELPHLGLEKTKVARRLGVQESWQ